MVFIFGAPAVGKMTVGFALAERTGLKLFHNHHTIELVLNFFDFGTPPFSRLVSEFRRRIFEEVAASDLPGLIFTYVWAFDRPDDAGSVARLTRIFSERGGRVVYVELTAAQAERLRRNETELRLREKPSKRDVEASRRRLLQNDAEYQLESRGYFEGRTDYLHVDNAHLTPVVVAERIVEHFGLPLVRNALMPSVPRLEDGGFPVFEVSEGASALTPGQVREALEDE
ncbi:MAG: AAA family ATPase [Gemmatimonas sp.]|nr:AAA family ATPase [Gemmatimonas sp.]